MVFNLVVVAQGLPLEHNMDAPAQAEMAMVIGNRRVPLVNIRLAGAEGQFVDYQMADLSSRVTGAHGKEARSTFWAAIGGDRPWRAPLVNEIKKGIQALRARRDRKGNLIDKDGKVLPGVVSVTIRGRELKAESNVHPLRVNLGESLETMNWFLKEIWKDLQHVPGGYEDPRVVATDELKEQQHMTNVLGELRKHHLIKSASYCPRQKRIRVTALGVQQPLYKSVREAHTLMADHDMDGLETFLEQTADALIASLPAPPDVDVAPLVVDHASVPGGEDAADQGLADQQAVADVVPLVPNDHADVEAEGAVGPGEHSPWDDDLVVDQGLHVEQQPELIA